MNIKEIIDKQIKEIWTNDLSGDYNTGRLLKEDSLKNAFYYHLRRRLTDEFLDEHDLQIYPEFDSGPLKGTGKRADLAIVKIDYDEEADYWGDAVKEILVIIELKYKANNSAVKAIMEDVKKLKSYIEEDKVACHYYLGVIREIEWERDNYILDDDTWANGNVTELVATWDENDEMRFKVVEHILL